MSSDSLVQEIQLERSLMKAPFECMNKSFRLSQKSIEKEITNLINTINDINKKKSILSKDEASNTVDKLITKMQNLKRKLEETKIEEENQIKRLKSRIEHLKNASVHSKNDKYQREQFNDTRTDRILIDYFLREGYYDTAVEMANQLGIVDYVDIDLFLSSKKVVEGLLRNDCTEALLWCSENKSKLKKIKSGLEFNLRIQEFIELVRANKLLQAISYARQHLSPNSSTNMKEIQRAMATLAFQKDTKCEKYRFLFDKQRWADLITQFKNDNFMLNSLTSKSFLAISLQSGLSVLKTESCGEDDTLNINCPLCNQYFKSLAQPLPISLQSHSSLVCRITGEIMNEDNPPMVLPNGNVFSRNAMLEMSEKNNGKITCPRTGNEYRFDELRRAYIS
eukprot:gene2207-2721_t